MDRTKGKILSLKTLSVTLFVALLCSTFSQDVFAEKVRLVKKLGIGASQFLVSGAQGSDENNALQSARKAALLFASDQLSGDPGEKADIRDYVTRSLKELLELTQTGRITRRTFGSDGKSILINVAVDVQVKALRLKLESDQVIKASSELSQQVGNPTILVLASALDGNTRTKKLSQTGHTTNDLITSFLTDRQWNIVDRKATEDGRKRQAAMQNLAGLGEDPIAQIAQLVGADIYVVFSVAFAQAGVQATMSVKAYDTATGSVLASSVKPSKQYMGGTPFSRAIREAAGNAMPTLFEQMRTYWLQESKKGRKYKIVVRADFSNRQRYRAVRDVIKDLGDFKRTVKSQETLAGILVSNEDEDDIADDLIDGIQGSGFSKVKFVVEQRGLLILEAK